MSASKATCEEERRMNKDVSGLDLLDASRQDQDKPPANKGVNRKTKGKAKGKAKGEGEGALSGFEGDHSDGSGTGTGRQG